MGSTNATSDHANPISLIQPLDPEEFRKKAHIMVDFIADYYKNIENYPVLSQVEPGYLKNHQPPNAPFFPESFEAIMDDIKTLIMPGMTHWSSPNFFGFFPLTISTASFLGEMLCNGFNSAGFNWLASPAFTELEMLTLDWLAGMLKLPKSFMFSGTGGGVLHGTTSEAVLCTVVAARERALEDIGKLVVYESDQTHSFFQKICKMAGIFPSNIRVIPTTKEENFSMSPIALRTQIEADLALGLVPLFICATVGTTSTTAVDPVSDLAEVANDYNTWIHVDAAYAGSACICPEFRHFLDGIDKVDSLSLGTQKWLLSGLDCACLWVKKPDLMVKALSTNPEYLKNIKSESGSVVDFKDWQIGTSRRFRALRLWLVMRSYGVENLRNHIRSDVQMAKTFERFVRSDERFEMVVPREFSLVCFRIKPFANHLSDDMFVELLNRKLLETVNSTGRVYLSHTKVGGVYMLRFVVGATLTEERHVFSAWELIKETTDGLLAEIVD